MSTIPSDSPSTSSASPDPSRDEVRFVAEALRAEADAVARLADEACPTSVAEWTAAIDLVAATAGHVIVSGMGKSGLIGAKISATLSSVGMPSSVLHPAEAVHGDLGRIRRGDSLILLSASGQTEEVVNLAAILQADGVPTLGISCSPTSSLAKLCTAHLSLGNITEACPLNLAPTVSTTAMLAVGDALALAASRRRNFTADDFHRRHPGGMLGAGLRKITEVLRFRVGDNLPVVPETATVGEALDQTAANRRTGAIVLVDDAGRLSGIFTDADFRRLMRRDPKGMECPVRDVMTRHPKHLTTNDLVRDAVQLVRERRLDEIPVVDASGKPVGLVDVQDLIAMKVVTEE